MMAVPRCPKCGKPLMVTQIIQGRERTHPCACLCEIRAFEAAMDKSKRGGGRNTKEETR